MEHRTTPPPIPLSETKIVSGRKIFMIILLSCLLMMGALAVWIITSSRESSNNRVSQRMASEWGSEVEIEGPLAVSDSSDCIIQPENFDFNANIESESLHRGIYDVEVFTAEVSFSGTFLRDSLAVLGDTVNVEVRFRQQRIPSAGYLEIGGRRYVWQKRENTLFATVPTAELPPTAEYSAKFRLRGSSALMVTPVGKRNTINIDGEGRNPSFRGNSLPDRRKVWSRRFNASWDSCDQVDVDLSDWRDTVGVDMLTGVDRYQKVERSLKYSFLIIVLTFTTVFFTEIIRRHPIPLLNYLLIGVALIIFYSLLLSFSEYVSFGFAFLIAAAMTVALITAYMWRMLDSRNVGLTIGFILTFIYASCYILLCISTYALLLGSIILYLSLAALMYASLRIRS